MKIGVLFSLYNCVDYFDSCVNPWFNLKNKYNFIFAACSGVHKQMPNEAKKRANANNAHSMIKILSRNFDFIVTTMGNNNWTDEKSKNYMLHYLLDQNVDLIWIVDGDEIYTENQIISIIDFIKKNKQYDIYTLNYKNYVFKKNLWIDDFNKRVIYWCGRNDGIKEFIFDTDVKYNNDLLAIDIQLNCTIDREIAFIDHYTWLAEDQRSKEKIEYQNAKYYGEKDEKCAFIYDDINGLQFNRNLYSRRNIKIPTVHETISINSNAITASLVIEEQKILINNRKLNGEYLFKILTSDDKLLYDTIFFLEPNSDYFTILFNCNFTEIDKIKIQLIDLVKNELIHDEFLYINFYERFFFS